MLAGRWPLSVTDSGVAWGLKPYDLAIYGRARSVGETIPVVWSLLCPVARPPALAKRPAVAAVWGNRRAGGPLEIAARNCGAPVQQALQIAVGHRTAGRSRLRTPSG